MRDYIDNLSRALHTSGERRTLNRLSRALRPRHGRTTYEPVRDASVLLGVH
jgi:hypothetical protein